MTEVMGKLPTADDKDLASSNKESTKQPAAAAALSDIDADLQARLENLRRE